MHNFQVKSFFKPAIVSPAHLSPKQLESWVGDDGRARGAYSSYVTKRETLKSTPSNPSNVKGIGGQDNFFFYAFSFFVCSQYIFAKEIFANIFFYALVLPAFIWHYRNTLTYVFFYHEDNLSKLVLLLFAYVILHTVFVRTLDWRTLGIIGSTISNYIFFLAAREYFAINNNEVMFRRLCQIVVMVASVGAILSFVDYNLNYDFPRRLKPWNSTNHEIAGASVYAICCLLAAYVFLGSKSWVERALMSVAGSMFFIVILFTQSRGPMVAIIFSGMFFGFAAFKWRFISLLLIALLKTVILLYVGHKFIPEHIDFLLNAVFRPDSYRISIFNSTIDSKVLHPWLGYGMRADFAHYVARNPHNLFLGTAFYLGIPALALLLVLLASGFYQAFKARVSYGLKMLAIALLVYGVMGSLTDNARIVRSPTGAWFFFWMPLALVASFQPKKV